MSRHLFLAIMIQIEKYPSIIARPYINASKKDGQWKDNQRYTFENLVTTLASYAVSDLLNIYVGVRNPDDESDISDKDIEIIESLKNSESLKLIGLEQMSLGKWCAVLRETTKILKEHSNKCFVKELPKLFQPASNKLWGDINTLVKYRNDDAHGVPISDAGLEKTLNERQKILDRILEQCSFLVDYKMSYFDKLILESDSQKVSGWSFINDGHESLMISADIQPPMKEILLINNNNSYYMKLRPLIVYAPIVDQESKQLSLYSKQLDKEGNSMHYLGVDGAVDIIINDFDEKYNQNLGERWKYLNELYSEENVLIPNLDGKISISDSIEVNEENSIYLTLDNTKSVDIFNIECNITFPKCFEIILELGNEDVQLKDSKSNTYVISLDELSAEKIKKYEIKFQADVQGSVRIPSPHVDFKYFRTEADEETGGKTESDARIDGASLQIHDPKSPDRMIPVINVNRHYLNNAGDAINNVEIGEDFIYELLITNIGMGAARDLSVEVVFPENLELVDGTDDLVVNLNPSETRSFRYLTTTKVPGQYKINLRDLSYKDFNGTKYISSFSDDYSIIVKSNIEKQFEFELADAITDFTIDDNEKARLDLRKKELSEIYKDDNNHNIEKWFANALFDASIKNIRKLITSTAKKRGYTITEKIINDTKKQEKLNNNIARKSLIFSIKDIPFFGIDITDTDNIIFHSIDSKLIDNIYDFDYRVLFACSSISGYTLPLSLKYEPMLWANDLDINWFKKWINMCITALDKDHLPILEVKKEVERFLDVKLPYKNGMYHKYLNMDCRCTFKKLIDRDDLYPQPKKPISTEGTIFRETGIVAIELISHKGEILLGIEGIKSCLPSNDWTINNIVFLQNKRLGQGNSDISKPWIDDDRVNWYRLKSDKPTNYMYIKIKNNDISNFTKLVALNRKEATNICLDSSLFNRQANMEIVKDNLNKLADCGFLLRPGTVNLRGGLASKGMLEVYPYKKGLGKASVHDCVGFLHTSNLGWKLYINFYNYKGYSESKSIINNNISVSTFFKRNGIQQGNRAYYIDNTQDTAEQLNMFFELLHKSINFHNNGSTKSLWPSEICPHMISRFINLERDINKREVRAKLLNNLIDNNIHEIDANKNQKVISKSCNNFYHKYNSIMPIITRGGVISLAPEYLECITELSKYDDGLIGLVDKENSSNFIEDN